MHEKKQSDTRKTVLVVDDAPLNRKLIRTLLSMRNARVLESEDAEKAVELAREHCPDLILMDLQLPGMNGLEAARILKADPQTSNIPVVILSAGSLPDDARHLREAGCAGLITKPFGANEFLQSVDSYLS